ncbi:thiolase family protein [Ammoniphilus sp. YIM 78166]|uniref:thiolase family protein n=1 Tax=Ammoniphilus sp. YIM 78166 TaxID=1644106 RepID=UPI0010702861|nr:thiolase family protein [Ammoniphilus sp. YIM 78166]
MRQAVIVQAYRTAIGKKGGIWKEVAPEYLAAEVMKKLIREQAIDPSQIDEVILGNAVGPGGNLSRLAALQAGFPAHVPGVTIDRQCGSGLEAINLAARLVQAGAGEIYLAGGVESTTRAPLKMEMLEGQEEPRIYSRARFSPEEIGDPEMGEAAENVAEAYEVSREEQDDYARLSYQKAIYSKETGVFEQEIVAIHEIVEDESPRVTSNYNKLLPRMKPVFRPQGTVTAGNSCGLNDGAAVALVMSREKAEHLRLLPLLVFVDAVAVGVDPNYLGIGPVPAIKKLLQRNHLTIEDIDLIEFNEAFASQVIASLKQLDIPWNKVNLGGGAIALGHPYGASGAILVTRLCREMLRNQAMYGIATLGIGGGIGVATLFRSYSGA